VGLFHPLLYAGLSRRFRPDPFSTPCVPELGSVWLTYGVAQVPDRAFPIPNVPVVPAYWAPPHYVLGVGVKIDFDVANASLPPWTAAALNPVLWRDDQFWTRGHCHDRGEIFRNPSRRPPVGRYASAFIQEVTQVSYPSIAHSRSSYVILQFHSARTLCITCRGEWGNAPLCAPFYFPSNRRKPDYCNNKPDRDNDASRVPAQRWSRG
jgi:hypothetical protein